MGTSTQTKLCCFSLDRQWFLYFWLEVLFFGKGGRKDPSKGVCCVDALVAAGRGWFACCAACPGQGLGTVCSSLPASLCLHGKLYVIISKWAASSFRHN